MEFVSRILSVRKPQQNILDELENQYLQIANNYGYVPVQAPVFLCLKRPDSQVSIEVQFGNEDKVEQSLKNLVRTASDTCIFITSSKARTLRLEETRALLLKKFQIKQQKYYFFDIENHRKITANVEWEKFSSRANRPDWAVEGPMPPQPIFRKKTQPSSTRKNR
jgi:hypothetical protein